MAGVAFKAHEVNLSNGTILQRVQDINKKKEEKALAAAYKWQQAEAAAKHKVDQARAKGATPKHWNLEDLKAMVSWFKCPGDSKMPATKPKLLEWYELTKNCNEWERNHQKDGEEAVIDEQERMNGRWGGAEEGFAAPGEWELWCLLFVRSNTAELF